MYFSLLNLIFKKFTKNLFNTLYNFGIPIILLLVFYFTAQSQSSANTQDVLAVELPCVFLLSSIGITFSSNIELTHARIHKINKIFAAVNISLRLYIWSVFSFYFLFYFLILTLCMFISNFAMGYIYTIDQFALIFFLCLSSFVLNYLILIFMANFPQTDKSAFSIRTIWFILTICLSGVIFPFLSASSNNLSWFKWIQLIANPAGSFLYLSEAYTYKIFDPNVDWLFIVFPIFASALLAYLGFKKFKWF